MVDLTFLKQFTKGDPQKMKRYISLYLEVLPTTLEEMNRNLSNNDWDQLRIHAHSLKPQADFMGISSLKKKLINIEEAVQAKNFDVLKDLVAACLTISSASETELKEMMEQL